MAKQDYSGYIIPVAGVIAVLVLGKKLTSAFNVFGDSEEDKANQVVINNADKYFSPNYWPTIPGAMLTTVTFANAWCKTVYDAKGIFNDDEAAVYGAFQSLKYKTQVSWMAFNFYKNYQVSLSGYLQNFLNTEELAKVSDLVLKMK